MAIVRASSKFQIAIPKAIRNKLKIEAGQKLDISESGGVIHITPIPADPIEFLSGIFKNEPSMTEELLRDRRRDLQHE